MDFGDLTSCIEMAKRPLSRKRSLIGPCAESLEVRESDSRLLILGIMGLSQRSRLFYLAEYWITFHLDVLPSVAVAALLNQTSCVPIAVSNYYSDACPMQAVGGDVRNRGAYPTAIPASPPH